jgi:hypothetical protein
MKIGALCWSHDSRTRHSEMRYWLPASDRKIEISFHYSAHEVCCPRVRKFAKLLHLSECGYRTYQWVKALQAVVNTHSRVSWIGDFGIVSFSPAIHEPNMRTKSFMISFSRQ